MKHIILILAALLSAAPAFAYLSEADCETFEGKGKCSSYTDTNGVTSWHVTGGLPGALIVYNGSLSSNGAPVNGSYDVALSLWAGPVGGVPIAVSSTNLALAVTNGQFTALVNTWGSDDLSRTNLHVEAALRRSGSGQPFVTLSPRQRLAHLPKALVAERALALSPGALSLTSLGTNVMDASSLVLGSLTEDKIGSGQVLKSINGLKDAVTLEAGEGMTFTVSSNIIRLMALPPILSCFDYTNCYWNLRGNGNIVPGVNFMGGVAGELDPVEFRVNNTHALRYEWPGFTSGGLLTPNIIGGAQDNAITAGRGSVISGGGYTGQPNFMENGHWGVIAGGVGNRMTNQYCVIGGGLHNHIHGSSNPSSGWYSKIGGGILNTVTNGTGATIGGGNSNVIGADYATVSGGSNNVATGRLSSIGGGGLNRATLDYATVSGGLDNTSSNLYTTIGGGARNVAGGNTSTVGGGHLNSATSYFTTVSGGQMNTATLDYATVAGGRNNTNTAWAGSIGGGSSNIIAATALFAGIPSGLSGRADSYGQVVHANGQFVQTGDAQGSDYVLRRTLTAVNCNNAEELFLDGNTAAQRMIMPLNSTWSYEIMIAGRSTSGSLSAGIKVSGIAQCDGAGFASLVGAPVITPLPGSAGLNPIMGVIGNKLIVKICNDYNEAFRVVACVRVSQVQNP